VNHDWEFIGASYWECKKCKSMVQWGSVRMPPLNMKTRAPHSTRVRTCEQTQIEQTIQSVTEE